jgi:hypothetical protein
VKVEQVTLGLGEGGEPFTLGPQGLLPASGGRGSSGGGGDRRIGDSGKKVLLLSSTGSGGRLGGVDEPLGSRVFRMQTVIAFLDLEGPGGEVGGGVPVVIL